jgi:uncharacterized membrane protein
MKFSERLNELAFVTLPWVLGCLFIAGVVHLASILIMPRLAARDAFARIADVAPAHKIVLLDPRGSAGSAPFDDPALVQGVCRYDLSEGPVRLRATLPPDRLMLFSFHARFGQLYYSMTDRSATRGKLDVLLVTRQQLDVIESNDSEDELPQDLRIIAPTLQGFLLFRALAEYPADVAEAQARILSMSCGIDRDAAQTR